MDLDENEHIHWERLQTPCRSADRIDGCVPEGFNLYPDFISHSLRRELRKWMKGDEVFMTQGKGDVDQGYFAEDGFPFTIRKIAPAPMPEWSLPVARGLCAHGRFPRAANYMQVMRYEKGQKNEFHTDQHIFGDHLFLLNLIANQTAAKTAEILFGFRNPVDSELHGCVILRDGDAIEFSGATALRGWHHCVYPVPVQRYSLGWRIVPDWRE